MTTPQAKNTVTRFEPRYGFAALVWCAVILWASLTPEPPAKRFLVLPMGDKIVHFGGYALLCWLAAMSLRKASRFYRTETLIIVPLIFSIVFGIFNEIIQMFVANRGYEAGDIIADTLGAVSVQATFLYAQFYARKSGARRNRAG